MAEVLATAFQVSAAVRRSFMACRASSAKCRAEVGALAMAPAICNLEHVSASKTSQGQIAPYVGAQAIAQVTACAIIKLEYVTVTSTMPANLAKGEHLSAKLRLRYRVLGLA
mmetsp:Transcript_26688/g.39494  ORF Transcript_26688/g.39494 Transcript_26688/m.39494 type:complete len:112 (+) Transcript_26688:139-474(+)